MVLFFKQIFIVVLLTLGSMSITGCSGGEANYSLDDVRNLNLVTGSAEFGIPDRYIIEENTTKVTVITITSVGQFSFTIAGGAHKDLFVMDPNSGQLSFLDAPFYLDGGTNEYEVVVGVVQDNELSTFVITVEVVKDITKEVPIIDYVTDRLDAIISIDTITQVKARPADETSFLTFSLDAESNSTFHIDEKGQISLNLPLPDFDTMPVKEFNVIVTVVDGYGNSVNVGPIVISLVENQDLIRPIVETSEVSVIENSLGITQIQTTALGTGTINQYILSGTDQGYFTLSSSGILAFKEANDYETLPNSFNIAVQAGDDNGNLSEIQPIVVTVSDLDEQFTFHGISDFTPMEDERFVGVVVATPNVLESLSAQYSLVQGGDLLEIDANGNIQFKTMAQKGQLITVQVKAESELNGSETLSPVFYVRVQDDPSKIPPVFNNYSEEIIVNYAVNESTPIATISANVQGLSTSLMYEVIGLDSDKILIDDEGKLYFTGEYKESNSRDSNGNNIYDISVKVTDNNGNINTTNTIRITLIVSIAFDNIDDFDVDEDSALQVYKILHGTSAQGYTITYAVKDDFDHSKITVTVDPNNGDMSVDGNTGFLSTTHTITLYAKDIYGNQASQTVKVRITP